MHQKRVKLLLVFVVFCFFSLVRLQKTNTVFAQRTCGEAMGACNFAPPDYGQSDCSACPGWHCEHLVPPQETTAGVCVQDVVTPTPTPIPGTSCEGTCRYPSCSVNEHTGSGSCNGNFICCVPDIFSERINCKNVGVVGGLTTLQAGQSYTLSADYTWAANAANHNYDSMLYVVQGSNTDLPKWHPTSDGTIQCSPNIAQASTGWKQWGQQSNHYQMDWTPTIPGVYTIYCRAQVEGVDDCAGDCHWAYAPATPIWCSGNTGSGGGSYSVVTVEAPLPGQSTCSITTVNPATVVSGTGGTTSVSFTGNVSSSAPAQSVRLFVERRDGRQLPGGAASLASSGGVSEVSFSGIYYYQVGQCSAASGGSCSGSVTVTAPAADYTFHCDVATDPGKCSGNPNCTYEGGAQSCPGWVSCSAADNRPFDVDLPCPATPTVSCAPTGQSATFTWASWPPFPVTSASLYRLILNGDATPFASNPITADITPGLDYTLNVQGVRPFEAAPYTGAMCPSSFNCQVLSTDPWWQVKNGDVVTNGDLRSLVPAANYFELPGDGGGFPGVPSYGSIPAYSTNLTDNVSATQNWIAKSAYTSAKTYDSKFFLNALPTGIVPASLGATIGEADLTSGGTVSDDYYYYEYDPALNAGQDLTISGNVNLGTRKVILITKGANVTLSGNINLTDGQGFFLLVAGAKDNGSKGDIIVSPTVGGGVGPNLEGIYIADNNFVTGTTGVAPANDLQLKIRGSVAGASISGGVGLQRDLAPASNPTVPAELFEFAPDQELLFPKALSRFPSNWREVAP